VLGQAYVERQSHCNFTPAELVAAVHAIQQRIGAGHWADVAAPRSLQRSGWATPRSSPTTRGR